MIKELRFKRIITLLIIILFLIISIFYIKEETTNKKTPKRATFVNTVIERSESYG